MLLATDQIVTQAAKWCHMFGGQLPVPVTFRAIINRGGEQGAQHSQALHSWFAHIPGLRVVMPSTPADARDLLVASVLCDDPVLYIDDRWLYELEENLAPIEERDLRTEGPKLVERGEDVTLVGCGHAAYLCRAAARQLAERGIRSDVIDLRVPNPLDGSWLLESVLKTGRLVVVDGDWSSCGLAAEIIARTSEEIEPSRLRARPARVTLTSAPAPTSAPLERLYYPTADDVVRAVQRQREHA